MKGNAAKPEVPYRGVRCGVCYWGLYDGKLCVNPECVNRHKVVKANRVYLSNQEAQILIAANCKAKACPES